MIGACTLLLLSSAVLLMMPRRQAAPPPAPKVMMPENPAAQREGAVQGSAGATLEKQASAADSYDARYRQALAD